MAKNEAGPDTTLNDVAGRSQAWTNPASLVVEASAGTGKTSLLIQRALWLLLARDIKIERLVALTFAEKAAAEMADRLRAALRRVMTAASHHELPEAVRDLRPPVSLEHARKLAGAALASFARARISTIHSFASSLLRLFPVESGVMPDFSIIERPEEESALMRQWELFLAEELKPGGEREEEWRRVLRAVPVGDLRAMAMVLASFRTDLPALPAGELGVELHPDLDAWLAHMAAETAELESALGPRNKKPAQMLAPLGLALKAVRERGRAALWEHAGLLNEAPDVGGGWPSAWDPGLKARGRALERDLRALRAAAGEPKVQEVLALLAPFAAQARAGLLEQGLMTYDGLLSQARALLRDHREVREAMKHRIDSILVDEVQDTDPLQLEILLYLAEAPGRAAKDWRKVQLAPGRLLLVGDPKQSIYGFRHADLKAYQTVMDLAGTQGAARVRLSTSMRSAEPIIAAVNACGGTLFADGQPDYLPLKPNPEQATRMARRPVLLNVHARPGERGPHEAEARAVADYVAERLKSGKVRPGSFAILFPKKLHMPEYADALRVRGIPVTIEEERRFYLRTEIADLINVLRLLADPGDEIALAGVLRGCFGRLTDEALVRWFGRWRTAKRKRGWAGIIWASQENDFPSELARTFSELEKMGARRQYEPAHTWLERVWSGLAVDALAAAAGRPGGRDAVESFKRLLGEMLAKRGMREALEIIQECRRAEARGEAPPVQAPALAALPDLDAVRLMTIHQAKGLEFPAVVLGDMGSGHRQTRANETVFRHDWSSGLAGISLPGRSAGEGLATLEGAFLAVADYVREQAQDRRVLYVALTRAREELIIPIAAGRKSAAGSLDAILRPALEESSALFEAQEPAGGEDPIAPLSAHITSSEPERRERARREYAVPAPHVTPSAGDDRFPDPEEAWPPGTSPAETILGELCHRVLEKWDYLAGPDRLPEHVEAAAQELGGAPEAMRREAVRILEEFLASPAAARLRDAEILGREVPLLAPFGTQVLTARADLLCRMEGGLVVVDFKLGRSPKLAGRTVELYQDAVKRALGEDARFAVVSLKAGTLNFL